MKKLFMIAMVAIIAMVACKKEDAPEIDTRPAISLSVAPTSAPVDGKVVFTVSGSGDAETDLTIKIKVDNPDILSVPSSVVLKQGEKSVTFEGIGKAEGYAKTTISCPQARIRIDVATVRVKNDEISQIVTLTSNAPTLTYSTATEGVEAIVNLTLSKAATGDITIKTGYNMDKYDWINDAEGYPVGVTWSEYPVVFPKGETTHSFSLNIAQGNAGMLPLQLISISGTGAKDVIFGAVEYDFVITKS